MISFHFLQTLLVYVLTRASSIAVSVDIANKFLAMDDTLEVLKSRNISVVEITFDIRCSYTKVCKLPG